MKKIISLALALAMTLALVPATAFASSEAKVSKTITAESDDILGSQALVDAKKADKVAPVLTLEADKNFDKSTTQTFRLVLENAEWEEDAIEAKDLVKVLDKVGGTKGKAVVSKITSKIISVEITGVTFVEDDTVEIPLYTKLTGGVATVTVDSKNSGFSGETKTFAKTAEGSTDVYVNETKKFYEGSAIDDLFIEEVTSGSIDANKDITVKVSGGFKFADSQAKVAEKITVVEGSKVGIKDVTVSGNTITFQIDAKTTTAATIKLAGLLIDEDGAKFGDVAKITVSGASVSRKTIDVGTLVDFGLTLTAEKKELPVIYSGSSLVSAESDNETLKVTLEESVVGSWLTSRKTVLSLPEGLKFADVEVKKAEKIVTDKGVIETNMVEGIDGNELTIKPDQIKVNKDEKAKLEVVFNVIADPEFTGDVVLTVSGPSVAGEKLTATVATVKAPFTVKSDINEVKIDYKNTKINDIVITEAAAGLFEKGQTITLKVDNMEFESGIKAKVTKGDLDLEKLDGDNVKVNKKEGTITVEVKSSSAKDPSEITISGVELYLQRNLPAGNYNLEVVPTPSKLNAGDKDGKKVATKVSDTDVLFANYSKADEDKVADKAGTVEAKATNFDTDSVIILKDFVKVVTGGRDMDNTFTTKITVPVGKDIIIAGTKEIKVDAAAYINKDGYTMLPVRAVTEALNGLAIVRWDDSTKTATISFGSRVFSMKVNSKVMNMNGVNTALLAAPEIKNSRIFLPLRDLGYALGLTDSKITWDAATSTATLN